MVAPVRACRAAAMCRANGTPQGACRLPGASVRDLGLDFRSDESKMSATRRERPRSEQCRGASLRELRLARGWTPAQPPRAESWTAVLLGTRAPGRRWSRFGATEPVMSTEGSLMIAL